MKMRLLSTCLLSIALHSTLGITLLREGVLNAPITLKNTSIIIPKNIFLEFVPSPPNVPNVKDTKPIPPTSIISERDTVGQNPISKPHLPKRDPYQKGTVDQVSLERRQQTRDKRLKTTDEKLQTKDPPQIRRASRRPSINPAGRQEILHKSGGQAALHTTGGLSALSPQSSGNDDFSAAAKKNLTSTAEILSEWSYNSKSHAIAQYFSKEFKKISNVWRLEIYASQDFASVLPFDLKKTVVVFRIMPDGYIKDLQIIEHSGAELAQRYPIRAIEKTAPFTPLPPDVLAYIRTEGLWIKIEFNYN